MPTPAARELMVRGSLAGLAAAYVGGWIAAQYVDTRYFALVAPGLVGLVCAWAVGVAGRALARRTAAVLAAAFALLGTGLSDRLVPGGQNLLLPPGHRVPPYAAAVVGTLLWPVLFGPPKRPPADQAERGIRRK